MNETLSTFVRHTVKFVSYHSFLACLHDQNKSGFFRGPSLFQPIRSCWILFKLL